MKTIKIAFYKNTKTLFGRLIVFKQRYLDDYDLSFAQYSHVELVFDDGVFFSSSEVDKGVRFKKIEVKPHNWDFIELKVKNKDYKKIFSFAKKTEGQIYDWWGIFFSQLIGLNVDRRNAWFCSEITGEALRVGGLLEGSYKSYSPAALAELIKSKT